MHDHSQDASNHITLYGKIVLCLVLFGTVLTWGWRTEHMQRNMHNPPGLEQITEEHPSPEVAIVRAYEWEQAHIFMPRQYVKIIRRTQYVPDQ